jgi:hypothetical protein
MKTIKTLSAALTVVFAFAALSASAATAHEWKIRGLGLTKSVPVSQTATYKFLDETNGASFICTVEEKGTVGPGAAGKITSIKELSCATSSEFCEAAPTLEALHLPWSTELVTFEGGLGNEITTKSPLPEWKWKCKSHFETWTETCGVYPTMKAKNVSLGVEETFPEKDRTGCSNSSLFYEEKGGILKETVEEEKLQAV